MDSHDAIAQRADIVSAEDTASSSRHLTTCKTGSSIDVKSQLPKQHVK